MYVLAQPFVLSNLRLRLLDKDPSYNYKFTVETSTNGSNWQMAMDRRDQEYRSWQIGNFPERIAVLIKIKGYFASREVSFI